jgi:hypothetical protein
MWLSEVVAIMIIARLRIYHAAVVLTNSDQQKWPQIILLVL